MSMQTTARGVPAAGLNSGLARAAARAAQDRSPCRVEVLRGAEALEAVKADWLSLVDRALERNILFDPEMALSACRNLPEGSNVSWLLVWHDEAPAAGSLLIGLFPLTRDMLRWGLPVRTASFWHHLYGFLTTPLVDKEHADAALSALFGWLAARPQNMRMLVLRYLQDGGRFHTLLLRHAAQRGLAHRAYWAHERAALYGGETGEAFLKRAISGKKLKEYRRLENRLAELGELRFSIASTKEELAQAVSAFTRLEARGWKGERGTALANDPAARKFLHETVHGLSGTGSATIAQLTLNGEPVAATILLQSADQAWLWKIAYDEAHARFSPGVLLVLHLTRALLDEGTVARVDSCALPGHPMIERIWRDRLAMTDLVIELRPGLVPGSVIFFLEELRRTARAKLKTVWNRLRQARSR